MSPNNPKNGPTTSAGTPVFYGPKPSKDKDQKTGVSTVDLTKPEPDTEANNQSTPTEAPRVKLPKPTGFWELLLYMLHGNKYTKKQYAVKLAEFEDEQARAEQIRQRDEEIEARIRMVRVLMASGLQPTLSMLNIKSGGKTTTACYVASVIAEYSRKTVLVFPSTKNTATSTLGEISGVPAGNLIRVRELSRHIDEFGPYRALSQFVPRTFHGVGVICEDENSVVEEGADYHVTAMDKVVRTIFPNVDALIFDHGNDDVERDSIGLRALHMSDVAILTAVKRTPISIKTLLRTYQGYMTDTYRGADDAPLEVELMPGERVATKTKLENALVVMCGVRPDDDVVEIEDMLNNQPQSVQNTSVPPRWHGQYLTIPADPYISQEQLSVADLRELHPETFLDILRVTVTALVRAAVSQGYTVSTAETGELIVTPPQTPRVNQSQLEAVQMTPETDPASSVEAPQQQTGNGSPLGTLGTGWIQNGVHLPQHHIGAQTTKESS